MERERETKQKQNQKPTYNTHANCCWFLDVTENSICCPIVPEMKLSPVSLNFLTQGTWASLPHPILPSHPTPPLHTTHTQVRYLDS